MCSASIPLQPYNICLFCSSIFQYPIIARPSSQGHHHTKMLHLNLEPNDYHPLPIPASHFLQILYFCLETSGTTYSMFSRASQETLKITIQRRFLALMSGFWFSYMNIKSTPSPSKRLKLRCLINSLAFVVCCCAFVYT